MVMIYVVKAKAVQGKAVIGLDLIDGDGRTEIARSFQVFVPRGRYLSAIWQEALSLKIAFMAYSEYIVSHDFELDIEPSLRSFLRNNFSEDLVNYFRPTV